MKGKPYYVVSFSGGKDSTCMLLKMLELGYQIDEIIFLDTGKEFPQMYEHIKKVEKYIERPITILKSNKSWEYYMLEHERTIGNNKGKKGYSWSDFNNRWCTYHLKTKVLKQYLSKYKDRKIVQYIGIAYDEKERMKDTYHVYYPLVQWEMTEWDALEYCYKKGFDWGGLYEKFDRLSCYLCPLKSLKELKVVYKEFPELWDKMKELDSKTDRSFRPDYTLDQIEERFKNEEELGED